jgi:hypothetical protein
LPLLLRRFWLGMALFTAGSALYTATMTAIYHLKFPYGIGILYDDSLWGDLLVFRPGFVHFRTPQFWSSLEYPLTYPAPLGVLMGVLFHFAHPVRVYLAFEMTALAAAVWWFVGQLTTRGIRPATAWAFNLSTLAMIWPVTFLLETANAEGFVVVTLAIGVWAVLRDRFWLGAILIGLAGSMKIFPLFLLGLLLTKRRYREFAAALLVAALANVAALAILGPTIAEAQRQINLGFNLIRVLYLFTMKPDAAALDHSLWVGTRYAAVYLAHSTLVLAPALRMYFIVTAATGLTLFFTIIRKLPTLNIVLALTTCAVLLPPLSLEYTLVHLLLPFALLCAYAIDMGQSGAAIKGLGACFGCFILLFNIETFFSNRYTFTGEARTVALIVLLVLALRYPFAWPTLDRTAAGSAQTA